MSVGKSLGEGILPRGRLAGDLLIERFLYRTGNGRSLQRANPTSMVIKRDGKWIQFEVSRNLVLLSVSAVPFGQFIDRLGFRDEDWSQDMLDIID
jgi:hypothetical protein